MKKKLIVGVLGLSILSASWINAYAEPITLHYDGQRYDYNYAPINLYINNKKIETKIMPPVQLEGRVLVPTREVFAPMGADVEWKPYEKKVYVNYKDTLMILEPDNEEVWLNGQTVQLDVPAKIINEKIMLPIRFVSETLGFGVKWDGTQRAVYIEEKNTFIKPIEPQKSIEPEKASVEVNPNLTDKEHYTDEETLIRLEESDLKNISYTLEDKGIIAIKKVAGLTLNNVTVQDNYREHKIVIDLNNNYENDIGNGILSVQDQKVKNIEISTQETTKLVVNEQTVQAINLREDTENIYIDLVKPKEKYNKIVFLDAGHGGSASGTVANGIMEKDINLKQVLAVTNLIEQKTDIKVYLNREDDSAIALERRTELPNEIEADLFVSMHNNSAGPNVSGTEVYYYATSSIGKKMAELVQHNILESCQTKDRKIKADTGLVVIHTSKMPAILIETGFLTNFEEAMNLSSKAFNDKLAQAVYEAIVEMFDTLSFR